MSSLGCTVDCVKTNDFFVFKHHSWTHCIEWNAIAFVFVFACIPRFLFVSLSFSFVPILLFFCKIYSFSCIQQVLQTGCIYRLLVTRARYIFNSFHSNNSIFRNTSTLATVCCCRRAVNKVFFHLDFLIFKCESIWMFNHFEIALATVKRPTEKTIH